LWEEAWVEMLGRPFPIQSRPIPCCDLLWDVGVQSQILQKSSRNQGWSRIGVRGREEFVHRGVRGREQKVR